MTNADPDALVVVGRIGRAHGLKGEVSVEPRTDSPDERFSPGVQVTVDGGRRPPLTVTSTRWHSGRLLVHFAGIDDRTAAEGLRGILLSVVRGARPDVLLDDEYYDTDLEGLQVRDRSGAALGVVAEVIHLPGHDLLACCLTDKREVLVPFVTAIVPVINIRDGYVVIEPPQGLLDPEAGLS